MRHFFLVSGALYLLSLVLLCGQSCYGSEPLPKFGPGTKAWSGLLDAFRIHTEESKKTIAIQAEKADSIQERKLANILLREWELPSDSPELAQPRPLEMPEVQIERGRQVEGGIFLAKISVDAQGRVTNAELIHKPTDKRVHEAILKSTAIALFRPAYKNGQFVEGQAVVTIRIEVR